MRTTLCWGRCGHACNRCARASSAHAHGPGLEKLRVCARQVCEGIKRNCTAQKGCAKKGSWLRLIVEKPFGMDLDSSEHLAAELGALFPEEQLYRIDHYLGKELMQNMLVLRCAPAFP